MCNGRKNIWELHENVIFFGKEENLQVIPFELEFLSGSVYNAYTVFVCFEKAQNLWN